MELPNNYIEVPLVNYVYNGTNAVIDPVFVDQIEMIADGLRKTIENVNTMASNVTSESYRKEAEANLETHIMDIVQRMLNEQARKMAGRTYDIVSEIVESNIRKEEFVNLLLAGDEEYDKVF